MKIFACSVLLIASMAHGYVENRSLYPIGEAESLMGNAGVALKGSTGSAYFNPAGLATVKDRRISLTGNTYMRYSTETKPLFETADGKDLNFGTSGVQAIPSSLITTFDGTPWTWAFAVFIPELLRSGESAAFDTSAFSFSVNQTVDSQFMLLGVSAGAPFANGFDFGAGCYFANYLSTINSSASGAPKAGSGINYNEFSSIYVSMDVKGLLCNFGIQKDYNERIRWGFVVRPPMFHMSGQARTYTFQQENDPNNANNFLTRTSGHLKKAARYDIPLDVSFGIASETFSQFLLLADVSYQFGQSYEAIEGTGSNTETKAIARFNFGGEFRWRENWKIKGGYALNPSAYVLKNANDNKTDFQLFTVGFETTQGASNTGLALFFAQGKGENLLPSGRRGSLETKATALILTSGFLF